MYYKFGKNNLELFSVAELSLTRRDYPRQIMNKVSCIPVKLQWVFYL